MGNRRHLKTILEEVWHKRAFQAASGGNDSGMIVIHWRDVMTDLGVDVLLL
jgi:hypothetical protein